MTGQPQRSALSSTGPNIGGEGGLSDDQLYRRFSQGDEAAFDTLARRHWDGVYGFLLRRLGCRGAAEDCLSETFLRVATSPGRYVAQGSFRGWLYCIARNVALDHRRAARLRSEVLGAGFADVGEAPSARDLEDPERLLRGREAAAVVRAVLAALRPSQREAFELCHFHGLTAAEIAIALDLSVASVNAYVWQARRQIILALGEG